MQKPINFYIEANGVQSKDYQIYVTETPTINTIYLKLKYPYYVGKKNETIQNSGNLTVPEGTNITWQVATLNTDSVVFITNNNRTNFININ